MDGLSVTEPGLAVPAASLPTPVPGGELALQRSPGVEAYMAKMQAYADAQRAKGLLVEEVPIYAPEGQDRYQSFVDQNTPVENLFRLGYQFNTNKGNAAKVKGNKSGIVWMDPYAGGNQQFRLVNQKGKDRVAYEGTGLDALTNIHDMAVQLSDKGGKKAHWKVEAYNPQTQGWTQQADDDPAKNILGTLADIALPLAGALLMPVTGGMSGALAAGLGAAGGSALSGTLQGKSIGKILGNAALSGGLSFAGGSLLGGLGAGGSGAGGAVSGGAGAAAGSGVGSAAGAVGSTVGNLADDIVVMGARGLGGLAGGLSAGAAALPGAVSALSNGSIGGNHGGPPETVGTQDIVVNGAPTTGAGMGAPLTVAGTGALALGLPSLTGGTGAAGNEAAKDAISNAQKNGMSASDIANYLKLGSLGVGLLGDLFGGGGGSGNAGKIPAGLGGLQSVFSKPLPAPTIGARQAREMPPQDWTKAGMRPEQSFFTDIPQTYVPPLPGVRDQMWDKYAEGGEVESLSVSGAGDGRADQIPALLSDGEYVVDAETVALLGNGSNKAGAKVLDDLRVRVRKHKGKALASGKFTDGAKRPEQYIKGGQVDVVD